MHFINTDFDLLLLIILTSPTPISTVTHVERTNSLGRTPPNGGSQRASTPWPINSIPARLTRHSLNSRFLTSGR